MYKHCIEERFDEKSVINQHWAKSNANVPLSLSHNIGNNSSSHFSNNIVSYFHLQATSVWKITLFTLFQQYSFQFSPSSHFCFISNGNKVVSLASYWISKLKTVGKIILNFEICWQLEGEKVVQSKKWNILCRISTFEKFVVIEVDEDRA